MRDLLAMFGYLVAVGVIIGTLAFGIQSIMPPVSAERAAEQPESTGGGTKVDQWKAAREARQAAAAAASEAEKSPQPAANKPAPQAPAYGLMAKKKAQAELAAGKHKSSAAKRPNSRAPSSEARSSFAHAPEFAPQPAPAARPAYGPYSHSATY